MKFFHYIKSRKKVVIQIKGGLGNQMFQYGAARVLSHKLKADLFLDNTHYLKEYKLNTSYRNFELNYFYQVSNSLKFKRRYLTSSNKYVENSFNFDKDFFSLTTPVFIKGYFQSYKYFLGYEDCINQIFSFPPFPSNSKNAELFNYVKKREAISVHIRRGDYAHNHNTRSFHGLCSIDYYKNSITLLTSRAKNPLLIFFSDDIAWVKENFSFFPYEKIFVDHNKGSESWKDMALMSSCCHNIIANSTFSWWGAYLNKNPDKIVVAPLRWFANSEISTDDLIPPQWIRL